MQNKIVRKGDMPLTFNRFWYLLETTRVTYLTSFFSQSLLIEAIEKGLNDTNYNPKFLTYKGDVHKFQEGIIDESQIVERDLQNNIIKDVFLRYITQHQNDISFSLNALCLSNYHSYRSQFLNSFYEIISKYVDKHDRLINPKKTEKKYLKGILQKQDWYIMLHILRNNASHHDSHSEIFTAQGFLQKLNKKEFIWKTITVTEGMWGHDIRYNDEEVLELFKECVLFIESNKDLFTLDKSGKTIPELG